jgi:hypothetical protein
MNLCARKELIYSRVGLNPQNSNSNTKFRVLSTILCPISNPANRGPSRDSLYKSVLTDRYCLLGISYIRTV